ncbi:VOC family protein [Mycobacterium antarcticum]|uniref:hypothetical protein n=1 Tax=Mycolicibacterium sp. TUM20984 TaxID=3023368 RepID=UPI002386F5B9|nr:hypothetical protein [Mycolicibacterium sp. TUM20984]GLP83014.1 hypothetical protein TUM20984_44340 [Mycolicibacterium sp. TUM20984]
MTNADRLTINWHHTSTVVTDVDQAIAFRQSLVDSQVLFRESAMREQIQSMLGIDGISCDLVQMQIASSGHVQEFIAFHDLPTDADDRLPIRIGQGHVAYVVPSLEEAIIAITAGGGAVVGRVTDFDEGPAVYCYSPSGEVIELEERRIQGG